MPSLRGGEIRKALQPPACLEDFPVADATFAVVHLRLKYHGPDVRIAVVEVGDHLALAARDFVSPGFGLKTRIKLREVPSSQKPSRSADVLVFDVELLICGGLVHEGGLVGERPVRTVAPFAGPEGPVRSVEEGGEERPPRAACGRQGISPVDVLRRSEKRGSRVRRRR